MSSPPLPENKPAYDEWNSLVSFAKFLELLVYSPAIHTLSPHLCEHTTFPEKPWAPADTPIPRARFDIMRHFSHKGRVVTMTLADVREVFEVHVPRLQILRRKAGEKKPVQDSTSASVQHPAPLGSSVLGESHKVLRREIMRWWQGLSDRMDQLVSADAASDLVRGLRCARRRNSCLIIRARFTSRCLGYPPPMMHTSPKMSMRSNNRRRRCNPRSLRGPRQR